MLQVQIIGRLGRDAEIRDYNGTRFVSFAVAVDDSYRDRNGVKVSRTIWVDCAASETGVTPYLVKGQQVFIEGDAKAETYESKKDNKTYAKLKVRVRQVQLLGGRPDAPTADDQAEHPAPAPAVPLVTAPALPDSTASLGGFAPDTKADLPF